MDIDVRTQYIVNGCECIGMYYCLEAQSGYIQQDSRFGEQLSIQSSGVNSARVICETKISIE